MEFSQSVFTTSSAQLEVTLQKNNGFELILDNNEVFALFDVQDSIRCPIVEYRVVNELGDGQVNEELFFRLFLDERGNDPQLGVDTDVALTDGTVHYIDYRFRIRAVALGESFADKVVFIRIVVCDDETVTS